MARVTEHIIDLNRPAISRLEDTIPGSIDLDAVAVKLWAARPLLFRATSMGLVAGLLAAFITPVSYTGVASFVPPSSSASSSLASSLGALSMLAPVKSSADLYLGVLKSRSVADAMTERFHLQQVYGKANRSRAERVLARKSAFEADVKSTIITIKVTDRDPVRARDMANAYLDQVRQISNRLALTESSQRRLFYEERLKQAKNDLGNAELALKQNEEKSGFIAPAGQTASEIQAIAQLRAEITSREVRAASLRQFETNQSPEVLRNQSEIEGLKARLRTMTEGSEQGVLSTAKVPAMALDYVRKERDVKYYETLFEIIAKQYENARLDEAHDVPLQVLDNAVTPELRSWPPRMIFVALGTLLGLLCGAAWVVTDRGKAIKLLRGGASEEMLRRHPAERPTRE